MLFKWDQSYSVGNQTIDHQHKELLNLGNKMLTVTKGSEAKEIFETLSAYTVQHFYDEEKLMEQMSYPHLSEHQKEHALLRQKLLKITKDKTFVDSKDIYTLTNYVMQLIRNHILEYDK